MAKRDPAWRMKIAASMRGNANAVRSRFSEELEAAYKDDPEALAWILANQKELNTASADGTMAFSDNQIRDADSKYTYLE